MSSQALEKDRVIAPESQVRDAFAQIDWRKYDGERVIASNGGAIYLILHGELRWIPDPATYNNLFTSWDGVVVSDYLVNNVPRGPALTSGALLVKGASDPVYLVTNGLKHWVPNPATFAKFAFNKSKIVTVPQIVIDYLPSGPNIG